MSYKIYLIKCSKNSAKPAESLFNSAVIQEIRHFDAAKDVAIFIKEQYKKGLEYFGKTGGEDGKDFALYFLQRI